MAFIFVLDWFTFIHQRARNSIWIAQKAWKKYYGLYICSGLVYFRFFLRARNKYYFRIALLSFIKEPGTNSMVIVFIPDCFSFIYQRVRNKYYGHYISSGLLYFHLPESPCGTNIMAIIFVLDWFTSFIKKPGKSIMAIIFVPDWFTFHISESPEKILEPLYSFQIAFSFIYQRARNKNYFQIALLSFIKELGKNIMAIIFAPDWFTFIYQRAQNKFNGHFISCGLLYFHFLKSLV